MKASLRASLRGCKRVRLDEPSLRQQTTRNCFQQATIQVNWLSCDVLTCAVLTEALMRAKGRNSTPQVHSCTAAARTVPMLHIGLTLTLTLPFPSNKSAERHAYTDERHTSITMSCICCAGF
jgi:hypothetical protein